MRRIFLICPVRNADPKAVEAIRRYVRRLERDDCRVHWPSRDTDQRDPVGIRICRDNREAIFAADEVHVWFDPQSQGSVFDLGMLFAFMRDHAKKMVIANPRAVRPTPHKSMANVLLAIARAASQP